MNANENFEKKRNNTRAIVVLGVALMSISLILFLITLFHYYIIVNPRVAFGDLGPFDIVVPLFIEVLIFVLGFLLFFISLLGFLLFLISWLKKNVNLGKKRNNARAIVILGVALVCSSSIPLFCYFALFTPAYQGKGKYIPHVIVAALNIGITIETLIFVLGFLLGLIGLLIGRLKKRERL